MASPMVEVRLRTLTGRVALSARPIEREHPHNWMAALTGCGNMGGTGITSVMGRVQKRGC